MPLWLVVLIIVVVVTCGGVVQKAIEAFSQRPRSLPGADRNPEDDEVLRLREQVESLTERLERVREEQRFLTNLLEERPRAPREQGLEQRPAASGDEGSTERPPQRLDARPDSPDREG